MIIYDDGSTDDTLREAMAYAQRDARIKVLHGPNKGIFHLGEHYAQMLMASNGNFIALLDGDDWWYPEKLSTQVAALVEHPNAVLCWGMADVVDHSGNQIIYSSPTKDDSRDHYFGNHPTGSILNVLYLENCIPALTVVIRRKYLEMIGGFQQNHGQPLVDLPTLLKLSCLGPFVYQPMKMGAWRTYVYQVTKTFPALIIEGRKSCVIEHFKQLDSATRKQVTIDQHEINSFYNRSLVIGYSRNGRYHLVKKNWKEGRKFYVQSILHAGPILLLWRLRSIIGLLFSLFHFNVEGLAKTLGRRTYE